MEQKDRNISLAIIWYLVYCDIILTYPDIWVAKVDDIYVVYD